MRQRPDLSERTCVVTGGTSGIGKATATGLASAGARVVVVGLDRAEGERARDEIVAHSGNERVALEITDLSERANVRALVRRIEASCRFVDVLVNNAGMYPRRRRVTADGHEQTLAVNYLATFQLTLGLMPLLREARGARVINVGSIAHIGARIDLDDLHLESGYMNFKAYAQSKLAGIVFTREFGRRVSPDAVACNCVDPGIVGTNIGTGGPVGVMMRLARPVLRSPARAADTPVYLASSPDVAGLSGAYVAARRVRQPATHARDPELATGLWRKSLELTGAADVDG